MVRKNNYVKYLALLIPGGIFLIGWFYLGAIYYPIDDAYISLKQASNLINGQIYQYSPFEPKTNSNTSTFYYLIVTALWWLSGCINLSLENRIQLVGFMNFVFNMILYSIYIKNINIYLEYLGLKKELSQYILVFILTILPISYVFISGLETGLTSLLILMQLLFFCRGNYFNFIILSLLLSINRPENIVLNFFYLIYILFLKSKNLNSRVIIVAGLLFISLLLMPSINYLTTGNISPSSSARVGFSRNIFRSLYLFFGSLYSNPDFLPKNLEIFIKYMRTLVSVAVSLSIAYVIFKRKYLLAIIKNRFLFLDIDFIDRNSYIIATIIVVVGYGLLPLALGNHGEWDRYFSPIMIFLVVLLSKLLQPKVIYIKIAIFLNLLLLPAYLVSHLNITSVIHTLLHPIALEVSRVTDKDDVLALDSAGYISLFSNGKVIDPYGLGTSRYAKVHGDIIKVSELLRNDDITFIVAWPTSKPTFYIDSAIYSMALESNRLVPLTSSFFKGATEIPSGFPRELTLYEVK